MRLEGGRVLCSTNPTYCSDALMEQVPVSELMPTAVLIRQLERRLLALFSEGKLFGTVHTCIGQELIAVALGHLLTRDDWVVSNHRCHGHFIAVTDMVDELIAEIMGKTTGVCGGWGGSQHICAGRFFSNGIQGGGVPIAAGLALAEKLGGSAGIAVAFIGEGTLGQGVVYETANLASKWQVPFLIVLENNRYSQSTKMENVVAGSLLARFEAFDISCFDSDTWCLDSLMAETTRAVEYVRQQRKPAVLRVQTDRLMAHSKGDDDRPDDEVASYWERDFISTYEKENAEEYALLLQAAETRIDAAVEKAQSAADAQLIPYDSPAYDAPVRWAAVSGDDRRRIGEILRDCFTRWMEEDERIVMIGEDIVSPYGGAFKVTKGLSDLYPDRVLATTISEPAIVGFGNGMALHGMRPVCEIMFGDFLTLGFDQFVNHASKFPTMYNGQVEVPLIVRTPMGGGRGYGPTHSQSIEKHFLGLPQTQVLALNDRVSPEQVYNALLEQIAQATLVIENKLLYAKRLNTSQQPGFVWEISDERYPTVRMRPEGTPDLTIACYGGMLGPVEEAVLQAFDELEIICEVVCPTQLYPMNVFPFIESLRASGNVLVIEEGQSFAAWGAELIAQVSELAPGVLRRSGRFSALPVAIPTSGPLEKQVLPRAESILTAIEKAANHE